MGAVCVVVAAVVRFGVLDNLGDSVPYITFYPAVIIAVLWGGRTAGLAATLLSPLVVYFAFAFKEPAFFNALQQEGMAVFVISGVVISQLSKMLARKRTRELYASELASLKMRHAEEVARAMVRIEAGERRFQSVFNNSPTGMVAVDAKTSFILHANPVAQKMYGYTEAEMRTKCINDLTYPDDIPESDERNRRLANGEQETAFVEKRYLRKDGSHFWGQVSIATIKGADGKAEFFIGSVIDITRQKEEALRAEYINKLNDAIVGGSLMGIAVYRADGPCVMANSSYAGMIGATVPQVREQNFRTSESWKRNGLLPMAQAVLQTGITVRRDVEGITSFGRKVAIDVVFMSIRSSDTQYLVVMTNDVLARIEAERAMKHSVELLEEKEMAKTRFLAAAGHDLRQPLAAANLLIDALKLTPLAPKQEQVVGLIDHAMRDFSGLLDALLNISKLDAGLIVPRRSTFNVVELFNSVEQSFAHLAREKGLGFRVYFPLQQRLAVHSDYALIYAVMMNLVGNAVKFTSSGSVLVSARRRGERVYFQVWDTGEGIGEEVIARIFDEFYQVDNPSRDRNKGLGLGLSIVKRTLGLLGSEIECHSRVGRGSVFGFYLPMAKEPPGMPPFYGIEAALGHPAANAHFARGKNFVVVENDRRVGQAIAQLLEGMGGAVHYFENAEQALRHAHIDHADYYISDYMLGGDLNGIEFLDRLAGRGKRDIKAVVLTGDTSSEFVRRAAKCDWPVLYKPVNASQLVRALAGAGQDADRHEA